MGRSTVYNNITSDETYKNVNEDNKELLEEFVEYLKSTDKSKETIKQYVADIKICFTWSLEKNKNKFFVDFKKKDFMKYQNYLVNDLEVSSSRVRRLRSSISSMSNFITNVLDDDYPDFVNIVNKIPAPSLEKVREKSVFELEDLQVILDKLVEDKKYQQACALALAMSSGARKSELGRFKTDFFKDENIVFGSLYKTPEKIKTKGRGSRGKQLVKYILVQQFKPYLDLWLEERNRLGITSEFLLNGKELDGAISVTTLNSWASTFSKLCGKDFYWHSQRHFYTTFLAKADIPDSVIKNLVGWANVDMVNTYKDVNEEDEFGKYFGENGFKEVENKGLNDL